MNICISEILSLDNLNPGWTGTKDMTIQSVSIDTRSLNKGDFFVALKGENFDGHHFIQNAVEKKAQGIVVEQSWYDQHGHEFPEVNFCIVSDTLLALQEFARYYRKKFKIPVIAITGSSGKTTTKEAMYSVLAQKFKVLKNQKSFNNHIGVPLTVLNLRDDHEILIAELGTNHFGELTQLSRLVEPSHVVLTNIGRAHLESFKTLQGVLKAKMEIFAGVHQDGWVFYNRDDKILSETMFPVKNRRSFGLHPRSDVRGVIVSTDLSGHYQFEVDQDRFQLEIPGKHNVSNALAAIAMGFHFGMTTKQIQKGIRLFKAFEKRLQIERGSEITIIDDSYNSNIDSCRAAIATLAELNIRGTERKIAILGDMLELGTCSEQEHRELAHIVKNSDIDALFLYGYQTRYTAEEADIVGVETVSYNTDKKSVVESVKKYLRPRDVVLVKGSRGMTMETVVDQLKMIKFK